MVFCSADYLKFKIISRSGVDENKIVVVNNAIEIPSKKIKLDRNNSVERIKKFIKSQKCLVYIGTIDEWFDYDSIIYVLSKHEDLNLVLIGPLRGKIPTHPRINYMGTVKHDAIFDIMTHAFALIMPFKLTELIRSVNPVKLYEYIYAGIPVIANKYGETMKFGDYVYLYENKYHLSEIINDIYLNGTIIDVHKNRAFVEQNTWDNRYMTIKSRIELLEKYR